jgi:hypothetical protein
MILRFWMSVAATWMSCVGLAHGRSRVYKGLALDVMSAPRQSISMRKQFVRVNRNLQTLTDEEEELLKQCEYYLSLPNSTMQNEVTDATNEFWKEHNDCVDTFDGTSDLTCASDWKNFSTASFRIIASDCAKGGGVLLTTNLTRTCDESAYDLSEEFLNIPDCASSIRASTCNLINLLERDLEGDYTGNRSDSCSVSARVDYFTPTDLPSLPRSDLSLLSQCYSSELYESNSVLRNEDIALFGLLNDQIDTCVEGLNGTVDGLEYECSGDCKNINGGDSLSIVAEECAKSGGVLILSNVTRACNLTSFVLVEKLLNMPDCVYPVAADTCGLDMWQLWLVEAQKYDEEFWVRAVLNECTVTADAEFYVRASAPTGTPSPPPSPDADDPFDPCLEAMSEILDSNTDLNTTRTQMRDDMIESEDRCDGSVCVIDLAKMENGVSYRRFYEECIESNGVWVSVEVEVDCPDDYKLVMNNRPECLRLQDDEPSCTYDGYEQFLESAFTSDNCTATVTRSITPAPTAEPTVVPTSVPTVVTTADPTAIPTTNPARPLQEISSVIGIAASTAYRLSRGAFATHAVAASFVMVFVDTLH